MPNSQFSEDLVKKIRKFVFDSFAENGHAPVLEELIEQFSISRSQMEKILSTLEQRKILVIQPSSNKILMLHPFSNIRMLDC